MCGKTNKVSMQENQETKVEEVVHKLSADCGKRMILIK
jgi:hypothetical protein